MVETKSKQNNLFILTLMASTTFVAILAELMPSGVLPDMAVGLGVSQANAAYLIGFYAVASAFAGIPLVSLTMNVNRKVLLEILLLGFACANLLVGIAPSFAVALFARALGGACAGTMWPMITAYAMKLVKKEETGRAITIVMTGITVGMSVGLPLITLIGTNYGFRLEFLSLVVLLVLIAALGWLYLPSVPGEKPTKTNSPFAMLKNGGVLRMLLLTFFSIGANYGAYTFITNLVKDHAYPGIAIAQAFFGIGSVVSVILLMRFIDKHIYACMLTVFLLGACTMLLFYVSKNVICLHFAFFSWGLGFGSLSSLFQTATAKQVKEGAAVANALQSSSFNFAIMFGSTAAGILLDKGGTDLLLLAAAIFLLLGFVASVLCKKYLHN